MKKFHFFLLISAIFPFSCGVESEYSRTKAGGFCASPKEWPVHDHYGIPMHSGPIFEGAYNQIVSFELGQPGIRPAIGKNVKRVTDSTARKVELKPFSGVYVDADASNPSYLDLIAKRRFAGMNPAVLDKRVWNLAKEICLNPGLKAGNLRKIETIVKNELVGKVVKLQFLHGGKDAESSPVYDFIMIDVTDRLSAA